ncbi:phosphodiester glycosidase family protein [Paenibacillus sp. 1P07SE]|uniref:phosphodiester glycosidase family protein n=1 Tax=Paenibacillus sp. 1P07SE TaxID=3132209 RepID=UPI0039A4F29E
MKKVALCLLLCMGLLVQTGYAGAAAKSYGLIDNEHNRTFVPIRLIGESFGAQVAWDKPNQRIDITKGEQRIRLYVGRLEALRGEETIRLEAAPFVSHGVTYVPLRFVGDVLGVSLQWRGDLGAVVAGSAEEPLRLPVIPRGQVPEQQARVVHSKKTMKLGRQSFDVQQLTVTLLHPQVNLGVGLAGGEVGKTDDLRAIASRYKALAAINGTFFDAYTDQAHKTPYGYIVHKGEIVKKASGDPRTVLVFDKHNNVEFVPGGDFTGRFEQGDLVGALQAGPRLVVNGEVSHPDLGGFRDPKILSSGGARSAVGLTRDHKLILLTSRGATIPQLAQLMKQAGAYQAMNLDGGASSGLYYNGSYLTTPGRKISNALLVY